MTSVRMPWFLSGEPDVLALLDEQVDGDGRRDARVRRVVGLRRARTTRWRCETQSTLPTMRAVARRGAAERAS